MTTTPQQVISLLFQDCNFAIDRNANGNDLCFSIVLGDPLWEGGSTSKGVGIPRLGTDGRACTTSALPQSYGHSSPLTVSTLRQAHTVTLANISQAADMTGLYSTEEGQAPDLTTLGSEG